MKIKIGENEYLPPFRELDDEEMDEVWLMDACNNYVKVEDVISALNELSQLRAENAALVKRVEDLEKRVEELENFDPNFYVHIPPLSSKTYTLVPVEDKPDTKGGEK